MDETPDVRDAAAAQEIQTIRADPGHAYHHPASREHEQARAYVRELYLKAYGGDPVGPQTQPRDRAGEAPPPRAPVEPAEAPLPFALPARAGGETWHEPTVREFHQAATQLGVSTAEVAQWLHQYATPADAPDPAETVRALRQEWGTSYDANLEAGRLALRQFPVRVQHEIEHTDLGNDPRVLRRLAELGKPLLAVREEIARIRRDASHPYNNPNHPRHNAERERVRSLYVTVYGDRPIP